VIHGLSLHIERAGSYNRIWYFLAVLFLTTKYHTIIRIVIRYLEHRYLVHYQITVDA
jgi:hypothetical protein